MSPGNTNKVPHHRWPDSIPPATDYGVGMLPLTGRTVILTGHKVDGTPFTRTLANCSYVPGKGLGYHLVVGVDVGQPRVDGKAQLRSFRLRDIEFLRLRTGGPTIRGADLVATINYHLSKGQGEIRQVVVVEEAA